ncbi:shikimate dehydrogenase [Allonocardiopsis opalescens]|uniref:Shikimate dehydrogenase n=1 Tax=Allonocardiopsis opalescens TaxID=1144618 RepID=A0A2T0PWW1_9ACTN|nr:shikimate dehydrogenase [Allonocardiopsis opalescens]PRX96022.1 shikimate dehydrogenase [Allonocardiopsis opalescens]
MTSERRAAVLGAPVAHSLSPVLHTAAYTALGLDGWEYSAVECREDELPGLLDSLDARWAGLSLTMPLKRTVLPLLDRLTDLAAAVGAANTVVLGPDGRTGHNTDVHGIVAALGEAGVRRVRSALVLGAGATAASSLAAAVELGASRITVAARDLRRTEQLEAAADRLGVMARPCPLDALPGLLDVDLLMSALPPGAADPFAPVVAGAADGPGAVFDVVYGPRPSPLVAAVRAAGGTAVDGLPMLLHQAARQVELMTGLAPAPVEAMRSALAAHTA